MKSLSEIRLLGIDQIEILSPIEQCVHMFFSQNMAFHSLICNVSNEELGDAIDSFDDSLKDFYAQIISVKNIDLFVNKDYMKEDVLEWFFSQEEYKKVDGKFNLKNNILRLDSNCGKIFSQVNPRVLETEISKIVEGLTLLEESLDKDIDVSLIRKDKHFEIVPILPKKESSKLKKCIDLVSVPLFFAVVLSSSMAHADNNNKQALDSATRAVMEQPVVKKTVESFSKDLEKKSKQIEAMVKESGGEIPAAIVGVGVKTVIDRKIGYKGHTKSVVPMNYEVSVGLDGSNVKLSNDNMFDKKMQGWISGSQSGGGITAVEVGVKYDF